MIVNYSGKKISLDVKRTNFFSRIFGLMFRSRNTSNLLFEFNKKVKIPLTAIFVFFPFLVIWLDADNKVIDYGLVRPFVPAIKPRKKFRKFVELPVNSVNNEVISLFVDKRKI